MAGDRLYLAPHGFLVFLFQLQLPASVCNRGQSKMQTGEVLEGTRRAWHSLTEAHWLLTIYTILPSTQP